MSLLISIAALLGWILHQPMLVSPLSGPAMAFSTALCFALISIAISFNNLSATLRTPLHAAISALVMVIAALSQVMTRSQRNKALMAVLYLDIDNFKGIKDSLGHAMGDALLKGFSRRLESCVRAVDTVARIGGDEFSVILGEPGARDDGLRGAEKIVTTVRPAFELEYRSLNVTTSVGVAFYDGASEVNPDALIKKADEALYQAKGAGRNNYQVAA